jgi:formate hydrogenlyase subunit 3/multisubunit Na+/H+ antiporter MnhD subunit
MHKNKTIIDKMNDVYKLIPDGIISETVTCLTLTYLGVPPILTFIALKYI